ncbi:MAG: hypothetical protein JW787_01475 [Sedimentisphaerales bacterium]|nr:hypothetical protein [Sedimentisphaerales bacterium]
MEKKQGLETKEITRITVFITFLMMFVCLAGCSKQFARIEENQAQLKLMAQANAENLAEIAQYIEQNQNELTAKIQQVRNETKLVDESVQTVAQTQSVLHETSQSSIQKIAEHLNQMSDNQDVLKVGLVVSHNETAQIANNLNTLSQKQAVLFSTVQNNNSKMNEKVAVLEQGQNNLLAGIEDAKNKTLKVSSEVAALGQEQMKLHETSQSSIKNVQSRLAQMSDKQDVLKAGLATSNNETAKIANNLTALSQKQAELFSTVQNNNSKLTEKVAVLEHGQQNLLAGIEGSKNQTLKVSSEVAELGKEQAKLHESSQNDIQQIANNLSQVAGNQEVLKTGLVVSHNETAKVANNVAVLSREQLKLNESSQNDILKLANILSEIVQNQSILKTGLVVSHNETAKVGNSITSLGEMQKELSGIIQNNNNLLSQKVAEIEKNQSGLQEGIEEANNQAKETAENISSVGKEQANLQETVSSYNQQLSEKVEVMEQSQKEWQETIKQMQESVVQVAGNIGTFEQNLSKLQEILLGKMGDLITAANTNNQGQTEFQEKMKKDLLVLADSVNVIKQSQSQLQKKIEDVQSKADSISVEFPAAIEKLRKEMTIEDETAYSSDK